MTHSILIKELALRNFGLLYLDLSHWQSYMISQYGQASNAVTAVQLVKQQLTTLAETYGGSCYRSTDNIQFYVVLKSTQRDFANDAAAFFNQAIDATQLIEKDNQSLLKKHGVIMHAGGCHFDEVIGVRKIWTHPKRAQFLSNLHAACVANSVFLTDLPIEDSAFYLMASEQMTIRYRHLVQERIVALLESLPLYQQWLQTVHIEPDILPNVFDYHRINSPDPIEQTALLLESICQDRATKSSADPYYSKLLLQG